MLLPQDGKGFGGPGYPRTRVRVGMGGEAVGRGHREGQPCLPKRFWGETGRGGMGEAEGGFGERRMIIWGGGETLFPITLLILCPTITGVKVGDTTRVRGRVEPHRKPPSLGIFGGKQLGKEPWGPVPITITAGTSPDSAGDAPRTGWDALRWECWRRQARFPGLGVTVNKVEGS